MNASYFREVKNRKRSGHGGLLILLVGVTILVCLYMWSAVSMNPFDAFRGTAKDRYSDPNAYPWEEGRLFIRAGLDNYDIGGRRPPFRSQPQFKNLLNYSAVVYDGDNKYGRIEMEVCDDGDVRASWSGEFQIKGKRYQAVKPKSPSRREMNMFFGNYAPLKVYEDENGKDFSKLYVITQGIFDLKDLSEEDSIKDMAFITCWIDKDFKAEGKLSIPSFADEEMQIFYWGPVGPMEK